MVFQDFLLDPNTGDLLIQNGDFVIGASDEQHIFDIITSFAGDFKQFPIVGVGIQQYIKGQGGNATINTNESVNDILSQLQADGYQVSNAVPSVNSEGILNIKFPSPGISRNG